LFEVSALLNALKNVNNTVASVNNAHKTVRFDSSRSLPKFKVQPLPQSSPITPNFWLFTLLRLLLLCPDPRSLNTRW